jgi:hypothetical protein
VVGHCCRYVVQRKPKPPCSTRLSHRTPSRSEDARFIRRPYANAAERRREYGNCRHRNTFVVQLCWHLGFDNRQRADAMGGPSTAGRFVHALDTQAPDSDSGLSTQRLGHDYSHAEQWQPVVCLRCHIDGTGHARLELPHVPACQSGRRQTLHGALSPQIVGAICACGIQRRVPLVEN